MSIKNHKDYKKEKQRLKSTVNYVREIVSLVDQKEKKLNDELKDAYINLDSQDSSTSYSTIMLNATFLKELEMNHGALIKAKSKPYFARLDIKEAEKEVVEELYIGKVSVFDDTMENPLVVDWRAPIASIYYDGRIGSTTYNSNGVENTVDLSLKRNYTIEEGVLKEFMDLDISTSDAFLQASLEENAGEKLRDIVSTIQAEQNSIIRADINKPLIVQGVAGSGKTTIALHRIAYLIYTYAKTFVPENFMIIAPNTLFLDYISQVLPELGADRVKQTTYIDLMIELIGKKYPIIDTNEKLRKIVAETTSEELTKERELILKTADFKNKINMKVILERYINDISSSLIPEDDYCIGKRVGFLKSDIVEMYEVDYKHMPIYKRIDAIKRYLTKYTKELSKKLAEYTRDQYDEKINTIRHAETPSEERRLKTVALIEARNSSIEEIGQNAKTAVAQYIKKIEKNNLMGYYKELITDKDKLAYYDEYKHDEEVYLFVATESAKIIASKHLELEDLAALVYLKKKLFGIDKNLEVKTVFIDEAQDFGNFQFFVLKDVLETNRFTILGDLSQGIHMYRAIHDWDYLKDNIFSVETNYLTLEQSYRTTIEIMDLANKVLLQAPFENSIVAKPVVRHGETPEYKCYNNKEEVLSNVESAITEFIEAKYNTIAVIAKSTHEAQQIYKKLSKNKAFNIGILDDKVTKFDHKVVVVPAHLSKGLEFDAVIIVAIEDEFKIDNLDAKLLYVAITRALHRVNIFYIDGKIPFLNSNMKLSSNGKKY